MAAMDITQYDNGIAYEALQEVLTQTIAYLNSAKYSNKTIDTKEAISKLVNYKKYLEINKEVCNEALEYMTEVRTICGI